ncbi:recombinase RecA [Carnobacteriaceae bacterium zg-C25]|nr:recombinase RecA [Carnobacteriaceae bacterium zg-C25]
MSEERQKALDKAIKEIEKSFGKGALMRLGDKADTKIDAISSGSLLIDSALGIGGFPRGRIVEIYGPESSGKTTTALHVVAEVQKQGGVAAYIDAEHAMDPVYAKNLGINIDDLFLSQPDSGEEALEIAESLVRSGAIDVVVIDSVAALVPKAEINGSMGDAHVGLQARLMSQALRKLSSHINKQKTVAIFINQLREKVGVTYGNPEVTPGGRALKFYSTIRMEVRKGAAITPSSSSSEVIGNETKIKIVKNKVAPPFKTVTVDIMYGEGISKIGEIIDLAVEYDIIKKAGSWYSYGEQRIGQGRETAKKYLVDNPEFMADLERKIRIKLGLIEATEEEMAQETANNTTVAPLELDEPLLAELLADDED